MFSLYQRYKFKAGNEFDMYISKDNLTCDGSVTPQNIKMFKTIEDAEKELNLLNKMGRKNWTIKSM